MKNKKPVKKWKPQENEVWFWVPLMEGVHGGIRFSSRFNSNRKSVACGNAFRTKSAALKAAKEVKALLKKLPKE